MSLRDVPIIGQLIGAFGFLVDLLLNSGELLFTLLWVLMDNVEILVSIVVMVQRLEDTVPIIPAGLVRQISAVVFTAMLVVYVGKLLGKLRERKNATSN